MAKGKSSESRALPSNTPQQQPATLPREEHRIVEATFQGPLPPPSLLHKYDEVSPGLGERIVAMAEKESAHRQAMESRAVEAEITDRVSERSQLRLGQIFGFIIAICGLAVPCIVMIFAPSGASALMGTIIGGGTIASIVSMFLYSKKKGETITKSGSR